MSPEQYAERYDAIAGPIHKVSPETKLSVWALAEPGRDEKLFEYFLNPPTTSPAFPRHDFVITSMLHSERGDAGPTGSTLFDQEAGFLTPFAMSRLFASGFRQHEDRSG